MINRYSNKPVKVNILPDLKYRFQGNLRVGSRNVWNLLFKHYGAIGLEAGKEDERMFHDQNYPDQEFEEWPLIAPIRNPFSRLVSLFRWRTLIDPDRTPKKFIKAAADYTRDGQWLHFNGTKVDFLIRMEHMEEDMFNLPFIKKRPKMPNHYASSPPLDWRQFYRDNPSAVEIVLEQVPDDFKKLGYSKRLEDA